MSVPTKIASGGAHTSRTMMLSELRELLAATSSTASGEELRAAVLEQNVLGKGSEASRARSFRYLRELYELDPTAAPFSALRRIWAHDEAAQPLIALASALTHDPALRGTASAVLRAPLGAAVTADDLAVAVTETYPSSYSDAVANKIGRNAASTWTQAGHLVGRRRKVRQRAVPRPASVAYSLYLASLDGREGELLFEALPVEAQDAPVHVLKELAREASRRGWLDYRSIGSVTEIGFGYFEGNRAAIA
jgi:hypothetical protein